MDMTRFLRRTLTNADLLDRGGVYEGTVVDVDAQEVRNTWRYARDPETGKSAPKREIVPVLVFADGWSWIPNHTARRVLIAAWGGESDAWQGRRVRIRLETKTRKDRATGRDIEQHEKRVEVLDDMGTEP
jgi:hypothetical protein